MASSARQAIACIFFLFIAATSSQSQVTPGKNTTASISGKVTLKNKGIGGVVIVARDPNLGFGRSNYRATSDQNGNYRITNIPAGNYQVVPITRGLVSENELVQKSLVLDEGDSVDDVNFSMTRGGVVTGKVTDADGRPVIEELVFVQPVEGIWAQATYFRGGVMTDDRGVYRAFGLLQGKYKVFVGQGNNRLPGGPRVYPQTFYPSVTDEAKATLVEVTDGGEATEVDIVMARPMTAFKVTGRIVDSEGKPIPNIRYGIHQRIGEGGGQSTSGASSNANGEFKIDGVIPGKYSIFITPEQNAEIRAEWVPFEVLDRDINGLVVKVVRASSVSGVVVLEGAGDLSAIANPETLFIHAMTQRRDTEHQGSPPAAVRGDGSFKLNGLSPGLASFGFTSRSPAVRKQLSLVRIERDGVPQPNGVTIKDGEQITGLRLVFKSLTASIRGQVKVEDGELPPNARMSIWVQLLDDTRSSTTVTSMNSSPQIDSRGRFLIEGLAGGTYEINIAVFETARYDTSRIFKQQVTVADNTVTDVTVMVKLKP